ncbi:MAG: cysteine--tRNA ligase [Planctomycetes bacterium]|jgi:cysteinyl-tRNA synthetase|nr:cysteine--tRNA ligase [Planctomycetota bacterium]MCL4730402.1 cysteine--tRNA ligase [Planctomycetota bacterium]
MSVLKLKNTYSKRLEVFQPLDPHGQRVTMYTCGPTVYNYVHIGNFRSFLFADILRRTLERNGYEVRQVMNITDVGHMTEDHLADAGGEDKLAVAARKLGSDPFKVALHFEQAFAQDARALRLKVYQGGEAGDPALHPRATRHIPEMLHAIQKLLEQGFAYVVDSGEVYFEVGKFPEYGRLSGKVIDELEAGARVGVRDEKRDPRDFALWKVDAKHLMQWDPHSEKGWDPQDWKRYRELLPEGADKRIRAGFPGWHIECSAMSRAHLGHTIDIHTGGEDNIFPHHECEIAQSYGAYRTCVHGPHGAPDEGSQRKTFARYWVHGRFLLVNNRKMSKRDGTFFTVKDLLDPRREGRAELAAELEKLGFAGGRVPASVLRFALIANQYTQPMNFSLESLAAARAGVERIQTRYDRLREAVGDSADTSGVASDRVLELVNRAETEFDDALNDNLNTPNALAAVFKAVGELNSMELGPAEAREALRLMEAFDEVLDVLDRTERSGVVTREQAQAWLDPQTLRAKADLLKHWAEAPDREALWERIEAGQLPAFEELAPVESLDAAMIELFVAIRQNARKARDFKLADAVRDDLKRRGVNLEDTPQGFRWVRA